MENEITYKDIPEKMHQEIAHEISNDTLEPKSFCNMVIRSIVNKGAKKTAECYDLEVRLMKNIENHIKKAKEKE